MKETLFFMLFTCVFTMGYAQKYDLIATDQGDSIACRIDSITDAAVYLKMKSNNKWVHTNISTDEVMEYKYDAVYNYMVLFKPGTSVIDMAYNEHDVDLRRAFKLRKTGRSFNIAGSVILGTGVLSSVLIAVAVEGADMLVGSIVILSGIGGLSALLVGIPINLTGIERLKSINSMRTTAFENIEVGLKPCAQYNMITQSFQPGVMIRMRF